MPPAARSLSGRSPSLLQAFKAAERRFESRPALLFLDLQDAEQTAQGARDGHGSELRSQAGKRAHAVGKANLLVRVLGQEGAHWLAGAQCAVEIGV